MDDVSGQRSAGVEEEPKKVTFDSSCDGDHQGGDDGNENGGDGDGIFINVTVPPGAEAGVDSLAFTYQGGELEVLVPPGSVAGDVLRIQVGVGAPPEGEASIDAGGDKAEDDVSSSNVVDDETKPPSKKSRLMDELGGTDDGSGYDAPSSQELQHNSNNVPEKESKSEEVASDNITMVRLGDGIKPPSGRSYIMLRGLPPDYDEADGRTKAGDGTCNMVWPSGQVLAEALTSTFGIKYLAGLYRKDAVKKNKGTVKCLEVGSGLGVCGLALTSAFRECLKLSDSSVALGGNRSDGGNKPGTASILLTDKGESAVEVLKGNIRRNQGPIPLARVEVSAQSLNWGDAPPSEQLGSDDGKKKFHLILGSDILYNTQQSYDPLIETIREYLCPVQGIVILAVRWRKPDLEREFFQRAELSGLKFELWAEFLESAEFKERCPCGLSWREYGNPESESSNKFLHETTVSVSKRMKSLATISEEDTEAMDDEEHKVFEELQVQVYLGTHVEQYTASGGQEARAPVIQ